jgi:hypothetical protein
MFRVLSDMQAHVLSALFNGGIGKLGYYLTGGTALAEFYLQHRHSDDLDLFTREKRPFKQDYKKLPRIFSDHGIEIVAAEIGDEFMRFFVSEKAKDGGTPDFSNSSWRRDRPWRENHLGRGTLT